MAESDVLEGELISGLQAGDDGAKDNIEHPSMLYWRSCSRNGDKADGIFRRDSVVGLPIRIRIFTCLVYLLSRYTLSI
jgi:hypothetical protein